MPFSPSHNFVKFICWAMIKPLNVYFTTNKTQPPWSPVWRSLAGEREENDSSPHCQQNETIGGTGSLYRKEWNSRSWMKEWIEQTAKSIQ